MIESLSRQGLSSLSRVGREDASGSFDKGSESDRAVRITRCKNGGGADRDACSSRAFFLLLAKPKAIHTEKREDLAPEQQANGELSMMTVRAVILGYVSGR